MTVDEFLTTTGMSNVVFGRRINRTKSYVSKLRRRLITPSLETAISINGASGNQITYKEMVKL
jgi:hypothetical protein